MIHLKYCSLSQPLPDSLFYEYLNMVPANEQERILKYVRWQDAHASLIGKILLLEIMSSMGLERSSLKNLRRDEYDKPFFLDFKNFNISHSGYYVICAASNSVRIGIDIEEIKDINYVDFVNYFTKQEWQKISTSKNKLKAFYQHWCAKEAYIKLDGKGLSNDLAKIELINSNVYSENENFHVMFLDVITNYITALAIPVKKENIEVTNSTKTIYNRIPEYSIRRFYRS